MTSPDATLNTVCRRLGLRPSAGSSVEACFSSDDDDAVVVGGGGGGGTEKRARSWDSVSRIRLVMSWLARRALVKILGGGKLLFVFSEKARAGTHRIWLQHTVENRFLDMRS